MHTVQFRSWLTSGPSRRGIPFERPTKSSPVKPACGAGQRKRTAWGVHARHHPWRTIYDLVRAVRRRRHQHCPCLRVVFLPNLPPLTSHCSSQTHHLRRKGNPQFPVVPCQVGRPHLQSHRAPCCQLRSPTRPTLTWTNARHPRLQPQPQHVPGPSHDLMVGAPACQAYACTCFSTGPVAGQMVVLAGSETLLGCWGCGRPQLQRYRGSPRPVLRRHCCAARTEGFGVSPQPLTWRCFCVT